MKSKTKDSKSRTAAVKSSEKKTAKKSAKKKGPIVAIDGPAGTGKSSVTKRLSELLGFVHVDTGALYRGIAYFAIEKNLNVTATMSESDMREVIEISRHAKFQFKRDAKKNPANRLIVNGEDITQKIRTPEMSMAASRVSGIPEVRKALFDLQRELGGTGNTILEGRDIGTVVFPDADLKFFLTASVEERAKRRLSELEAMGSDVPSFEEVKRQISDRDFADSTRAVAPLKKAKDAVEIDTTAFTLDEVVAKMRDLILEKAVFKK